ncbi:hypothetical protein, variant [Verruconis gallopava]|uniref:C2H2-type domain-containing protein n=1 Tax=Verruconis gallopava TaxID=253628 RepID=A0A0D2A309_9PEZI|nr:hypothetical protein, variant [Verruconis gallopava]KIW01163.1 hypothetical protein, variant [Verruconis gallopava]
MSTADTTAAAAGAAAAAAAAAPQGSPSQSNATAQPLGGVNNNNNVAGDSLICQWTNCGERLPSPEQLYDHVCERHVGRKSTNNLNLTCQWGSCRTTTVKRDHITSHIRVHVPLKPHKCDFCGKAFKRPQDLKKHVKTHADDSVLLRSPDPNRGGQAGYGGGNKPSGYYPDQHHIAGQPVYYQSASANPSAYHGPGAPQQSSAYGPVYYAVSQPQNLNAEYEMRKKAAFDALNEFFGDAKERRIDPTTYYDVGHRLMALQTIPAPVLAGYTSDAYGGASIATGPQLLQPQYSLPLPNLRTKSDLLSIDQFLDQLQQTVYENSNQAAAAGVAVPGAHAVHTGLNFRTSNSPPTMPAGQGQLSSHAAGIPTTTGATDTPALTPASSVLSYTSGHSPSSVNSTHNISPSQRPSAGPMYPTLPGVNAMAEGASGLGSSFDADLRRRYSGGQLQKGAPSAGDVMETEDTPVQSPRSGRDSPMPKIDKLGVSSPSMRNSNLDPALRSPGAFSEGSASDYADKVQEAWIENVRTIEMLRNFVKEKLERGDYVRDDEDDQEVPKTKTEEDEAASLYPVLREVTGH